MDDGMVKVTNHGQRRRPIKDLEQAKPVKLKRTPLARADGARQVDAIQHRGHCLRIRGRESGIETANGQFSFFFYFGPRTLARRSGNLQDSVFVK